jgi:hypothetical protein
MYRRVIKLNDTIARRIRIRTVREQFAARLSDDVATLTPVVDSFEITVKEKPIRQHAHQDACDKQKRHDYDRADIFVRSPTCP